MCKRCWMTIETLDRNGTEFPNALFLCTAFYVINMFHRSIFLFIAQVLHQKFALKDMYICRYLLHFIHLIEDCENLPS